MDRNHWLKVKEIMFELEEVPAHMRKHWAAEACAGDQTLFADVLDLLDIDSSPTSQLEKPFQSAQKTPVLENLEGAQMGPWRLERELGRGGMGSVWLARRADRQFNMMAAVKLVKTQHASTHDLALFLRERQIMANLKHPNIAMLLDGGATEDHRPFLVMEYVEGQTIDVWLKSVQPSRGQVLNMFRQICLGLTYAHRKGVLHRDIKCRNIMVTGENIPKILDFGIASHGDSEENRAMMLTPEFAPPESLENQAATASGDLYSLGLVLLQMLTGKRPRDLDGPPQQEVQSAKNISGELSEILTTLVAANPQDRYQSADDLLMDVERLLGGLRSRRSVRSKSRYHATFWHHPDDTQLVETVARRLEDEHHLRIWLAAWHLAPGELMEEALRLAVSESQCCVAPLGPSGKPPWLNKFQKMEMEAMHARKPRRIIPLLLPGAIRPRNESALPKFLRRRAWASLSENLTELQDLAKAIQGRPGGRDSREFETLCPFRGLAVFREQDQRFFFGREALMQRLRNHMAARSFMAVMGPSGSGKSSLTQAGLVPILRRQGDGVLIFHPALNPLQELAHAFEALFGERDLAHLKRLKSQPNAIHQIAAQWCELTGASRLCLVVEQFEEIFNPQQQPQRFLDLLLNAIVRPDPRVAVVITMRSDFLGHCQQYPVLHDFILENAVQLRPLAREALGRVIEEPAREVGLSLEKGLTDLMLDHLATGSGVLPLLQHALHQLYHLRSDGLLTLSAYREIGGVEGAFIRRAEDEYQQLNGEEKVILRKMVTLSLVQPGQDGKDRGRRSPRSDLIQATGRPQAAESLLQRLTQLRLLTAHWDATQGVEFIDPAHQALIQKWERVRQWMTEDRETVLLLDRLRGASQIWHKSGRHPDLLLRGEPLDHTLAAVTLNQIHPGQLEQAYLARAKARREEYAHRALRTEKNLKRWRLLAITALLGLIMILVL